MITGHGWPVALTPLSWPIPQAKCGGHGSCPECQAGAVAADMMQRQLAGEKPLESDLLRGLVARKQVDVLADAEALVERAAESVAAWLEQQRREIERDAN